MGPHYRNNAFIPNPNHFSRKKDEGVIWVQDTPWLMVEIPKRVRRMGIEDFMDWFYKHGYFGALPKKETVFHLMATRDVDGYPLMQFEFSAIGRGSHDIEDMISVAWKKLKDYEDYCTWLYKRRGFTETHRAKIVEMTRYIEMLHKLSTP